MKQEHNYIETSIWYKDEITDPDQIIAEFFSAAVNAYDESKGDLKMLTQRLKERSGRKGPDLFMPLRVALTGQAHGPELAQLMKLMPPDTIRRRLSTYAQNPQ